MIKCNLEDYYNFMTTENNESIFVIKVTECKGRDNVAEKTFEEIKAKIFPNMLENIKPQVLSA